MRTEITVQNCFREFAHYCNSNGYCTSKQKHRTENNAWVFTVRFMVQTRRTEKLNFIGQCLNGLRTMPRVLSLCPALRSINTFCECKLHTY